MTQGIIYMQHGDGSLIELRPSLFESEDRLQQLIAEHPALLAGDLINPDVPRNFLLLKREKGIGDRDGGGHRWSLDHLFVDQDAMPTLVEVKRSTNTEIRRRIVGQMLDYAANATRYWPIGEIRDEFNGLCELESADPGDRIRQLIGPDGDVEQFWRKVEENLSAGHVRMLFVADDIPPELQRVVEFLNEGMPNAEVLAVAVPLHQDESGRALLAPRLIGATEAANLRRGGRRSNFQSDLEAASELMKRAHSAMCEWALQRGLTERTTQATKNFEVNGRLVAHMQPRSDFVAINLEWLRETGRGETAEQILAQLSEIAGRRLTDRYPHLGPDVVAEQWARVVEVLDQLIELHQSEPDISGGVIPPDNQSV